MPETFIPVWQEKHYCKRSLWTQTQTQMPVAWLVSYNTILLKEPITTLGFECKFTFAHGISVLRNPILYFDLGIGLHENMQYPLFISFCI